MGYVYSIDVTQPIKTLIKTFVISVIFGHTAHKDSYKGNVDFASRVKQVRGS